MSYPAKHSLKLRQGDTYKRTLTWIVNKTPVNLTGYDARLQIREDPDDATPALDASDYLTLGGAAGTIEVEIPASETADLEPGRYVYDLEVESGGGEVTTLIAGSVTVTAEVTR